MLMQQPEHGAGNPATPINLASAIKRARDKNCKQKVRGSLPGHLSEPVAQLLSCPTSTACWRETAEPCCLLRLD